MTQSDTRASDQDRERMLRLLQRHTAAGRLSLAEFTDRSGQAVAARTRDELAVLAADLPALVAAAPDGHGGAETGCRCLPACLLWPLAVLVAAVVGVVRL